MANPRFIAVNILKDLLVKRVSLTKNIPIYFSRISNDKEKAWVQETCYGVVRFYPRLDFMAKRLFARKFLKEKDIDIYLLILLGIYQLAYMRVPRYAAVNETVKVARLLKKPWAVDLVNAMLRNFSKDQDRLLESVELDVIAKTAHPEWLLRLIQQSWPQDWQSIVLANNEYPPMALRINARKVSRDIFFEKLRRADIRVSTNEFCRHSVILEQPMGVQAIPGFQQGEVSVQDSSAQLAADLLDLNSNLRVLDACASPGGKLTHILEKQSDLKSVVGVDVDKARLFLVRENLKRLGLSAQLFCEDVTKLDKWFDGELFDRILVDAPCSSTGVIRRHPEIKLLRQYSDIARFASVQLNMLISLWPALKEKGKLLYVTCSILPTENVQVIEAFLNKMPTAHHIPIEAEWGVKQKYGRQILTGSQGMDGFYYALLEKRSE